MSQETPTPDRKFFLFQANPKVWDLQKALREGGLRDFNMSRLKGEVVPGSMVILGTQLFCQAVTVATSTSAEWPQIRTHKSRGLEKIPARVRCQSMMPIWKKV